jgi:hypothetical protein
MPRNYLRSVVCKGECVSCKDLHHGTGRVVSILPKWAPLHVRFLGLEGLNDKFTLAIGKEDVSDGDKEDYWWGRMFWSSEEFDLVLTPQGFVWS